MGKGSNVKSGTPQFRSGNIVTPPQVRVTKPQSVKKDIIAPDPLIGATNVQHWYGNTSIGETSHGPAVAQRESLAIERANVTPAAPVWHAERRGSTYVETSGKKVRVMRTLDDGDEPLSVYRAATVEAVKVIAQAAPKAKRAQKIARDTVERAPLTEAEQAKRDANRETRKREDDAIRAYLRSLGYTGKIDARKRSLALDALTHAATVAAYGKGARRK